MKQEAVAIAKDSVDPETKFPAIVETEKLSERMAELALETSKKAYEYFLRRGNVFGSHFDDWLKAEMEVLRPVPMEITQTDEIVNVRAAVPGFKPNEIEISIKDAVLIISGETHAETKKEDEITFLTEWQSDRFCRQMRLPSEVETEGVTAQLKDGILHLTFKKKAAEDAATIAVTAA